MIYLASPYTHEYPEIMQMRYEFVLDITAHLMKQGCVVFSPIVHCHNIAIKHDLPRDFKFWQRYNEAAIDSCFGFMIAAIDGWKESTGIRSEYDFAVDEGKTIGMVEPLLLGDYRITKELPMNPFI